MSVSLARDCRGNFLSMETAVEFPNGGRQDTDASVTPIGEPLADLTMVMANDATDSDAAYDDDSFMDLENISRYLLSPRREEVERVLDATELGSELVLDDTPEEAEPVDAVQLADGVVEKDALAGGASSANRQICIAGVNNETEVMRAAKALFTKRTRTLYHWMYPDTPKIQLKAVVADAWDSMLPSEKQFYVSQVLGKFGCLQSQLMVNPQLDAINTAQVRLRTAGQQSMVSGARRSHDLGDLGEYAPYAHARARYVNVMPSRTSQHQFYPSYDYQTPAHYVPVSTAHAYNIVYDRPALSMIGPMRRRRGRPRGASHAVAQQQRYEMQALYEQGVAMRLAEGRARPIGHAPGNGRGIPGAQEEFNDDPELQNEFEKFQWAMDMNDCNIIRD